MGCLSIFNSNKIISNISANGALLYMVMYVRETARRSSAECFASLRSVQGQSPCAAWRLFLLCGRGKQGFEGPKASNRMERGVVPALHFTCWYFIPNPENSKAPDLEVESFFGVAPMRALWFYATAVTAVTMFCTFSLAVTAVTVVTCIYEFMGDSLCTYVHERASWYVRTQRLSVKLHIQRPCSALPRRAHGTLQPSG